MCLLLFFGLFLSRLLVISLGLVFVWFYGFSLGGLGLLSCAPLRHYFCGSFFEYIHLIKKKERKLCMIIAVL